MLLDDGSLVLIGFSISNMPRLRVLCRVGRKLPFDISYVSIGAVLNKLCLLFPTLYGFKFGFYLKLEDTKKLWKFFFEEGKKDLILLLLCLHICYAPQLFLYYRGLQSACGPGFQHIRSCKSTKWEMQYQSLNSLA